MSERFRDRVEAGRRLGERLVHHAGTPGLVVLGLPRGGIPVAHEIACRIGAPLDAFLVRKLGVPGREELALGAVASGGTRELNHEVVEGCGLSAEEIEQVSARELETLEHQEGLYRGIRAPAQLLGAPVILVDDGLATGASMRVAIRALRTRGVASIVAAVPVAPRRAWVAFAGDVEELVCPNTPEPFTAVGMWYRDFSPVSDEQVRALLADRTFSS